MKKSEMIEEIVLALRSLRSVLEYKEVAEIILNVVTINGMAPPAFMKPIPFDEMGKQYPLILGDFKNENGIWCTPGQREWENEEN